jgi:predicted ester cyclase
MAFLERWFEEVWNKGNENAIDEMAQPDAITHGLEHPDGTPVTGKQAFKDFHKKLLSTFSKIHIQVEQTLHEGDMTVARCLVTAVYPGLGPEGKPQEVKFTGMCMVRLKDGKLAEAWNNFDLGSVYRQIPGIQAS